MWIFLNNAFLSIVDKGGDGTTLLVRARRSGDIERAFPEAKVERTPGNDYRFRARLGREEVAAGFAGDEHEGQGFHRVKLSRSARSFAFDSLRIGSFR